MKGVLTNKVNKKRPLGRPTGGYNSPNIGSVKKDSNYDDREKWRGFVTGAMVLNWSSN